MKNDDDEITKLNIIINNLLNNNCEIPINNHVVVLHNSDELCEDELFHIISQLIEGNCLSVGESAKTLNEQIDLENDLLSNKNKDPGIDVWGESFRNDQRDVHMYKGYLTNIMPSVFDRIH